MNRLAALVLALALAGSACAGPDSPAPEPTPPTASTEAPTLNPEPMPDPGPTPEPATDPATAEVPDPAPVDEAPEILEPPSAPAEALDPVVDDPAPTPSTVPPEPDPVEAPQPSASRITDDPPADEPLPGSPLEPGGLILGALTPDGRPDNGYPDNRHQGDRTIAVYVESELRPFDAELSAWLRDWNAYRSRTGRWPYFVSAVYVPDCRWRGTGTVTVCAVTSAEMVALAGENFTGLAKANRINTRHHLVDGSAMLLNTEKLAAGTGGFDVARTLDHEMAHVWGLGHQGTDPACGPESDAASLMSYCPSATEFDDDDEAALNRLYGSH